MNSICQCNVVFLGGESEPICRETVALPPPRYKPGARSFLARHAMPLSASEMFACGRNTVHASAEDAPKG